MAYKPLWDWLDNVEGKKKGTSWKNLERELELQGYKKKRKGRKK